MDSICKPSAVHAALKTLDLSPSKAMGQNFLVDGNVRDAIVEAAKPDADTCVLEVGPGLGALTERLIPRVQKLIALEKDHRLAAFLRTRFEKCPNFELMEGDAVKADLPALAASGSFDVISNLPYRVGTRILVDLVTAPVPPRRLIVTLQDEVAYRITAKTGSSNYGVLGIICRSRYTARVVRTISPTCFHPVPRVDSAVVQLERLPEPLAGLENVKPLLHLLKLLFARRRKQLGPQLNRIPHPIGLDLSKGTAMLVELDIDPRTRPERLDPETWAKLVKGLLV